MENERIIRTAEFDPKVCTYWLVSGVVLMTVIVVGIPFIPFFIIFGLTFTKRYLTSMECVLTDKALKFKKGIFTQIEKTIPLEKITDMGMVQGPIMRSFDLHTLSVETAGQSGPGALLSLTGIVDAQGFRESVLAQRDAISSKEPVQKHTLGGPSKNDERVLEEIRDALLRIEGNLSRKSG